MSYLKSARASSSSSNLSESTPLISPSHENYGSILLLPFRKIFSKRSKCGKLMMAETDSRDPSIQSEVQLPQLCTSKKNIWRSETNLSRRRQSAIPTMPLPSFTVTAPPHYDHDPSPEFRLLYFPRKFSIQAFRKLSGSSSISHSDSMVSVSYKALVNYIYDDNFDDFKLCLNSKRIVVDDKDDNGTTALHFAVSCGKLRFVQELLSHGADPNVADCDNWCPLALAAKEGFTDICLALMDHSAELEHKDMGSWTSLMWACYKGREETVIALVNRGADVNAYGNHHVTALMWATGRGHSNIVKFLVSKGAKVTIRDKFGTTALIWAARKGDVETTKLFIDSGAIVDASGMYCWTPLIVAAMGNHVEIVELLLEHKANVNCTDKDGCTALTIACREGFYDIVIALLDAGAYLNVQDKTRDSNLIYAVKNGHRSIVEALLKRYADVNIVGKDNKTALFCAVEKGNTAILKLILDSKPDLEIPAKDGDTPILRAVRYHNYLAVKMLQEAGAKVDVRDKRGDNPLHIAMRARSKTITELLISDVRNAHLLNCPNNIGETPYQIDYDDDKPVMHQIYGARTMNSNTENEKNLGYDLYSCALAAILSEPDISMPITIGLYAKWGSGKSFLLNKVMEEMKNFSRQWLLPMFEFQWLLAIIILHFTILIGITVTLITDEWIIGGSSFVGISLFSYCWLLLIYYAGTRVKFLYRLNLSLTQKMKSIRVILQIIFCHPPDSSTSGCTSVAPIKYYFTNQSKVTTTSAGENIIVNLIGTLFDSIESDHGTLPTRLYRAFTPKPLRRENTWKWRKLCCVPNIVLFEFNLICIVLSAVVYLFKFEYTNGSFLFGDNVKPVILTSCAIFVAFCAATNLYSCTHIFKALMFPQRKHLQKAISALETVKSEGFMEALRSEVILMINMVRCFDTFLKQQSRLVVVVDGLDSCEQDKVLLVLDTVNTLFSDNESPVIIFLSIDPFIISKMIEVNSRKLLSETIVGGHEYLRNLVQLPFFLQNSGLRKLKVAQKCSQQRKSFSNQMFDRSDEVIANNRRMSNESGISSREKLQVPQTGLTLSNLSRNAKGGSKKIKLSESVASSIGSNLNRMGGAQDLTQMLCSDDYFSEINPRSMRRLMNVACVTGRLLKSFQIEFNWYHLASWVNITEQWPYRTTCLILYHDAHEDSLEDSMTLKQVYDKIRAYIPVSKDIEPLLEFDRDEKKFNIFLKYHRSSLQVADLRIFLPFTINLDPHIKKIIKEKQQKLEDTAMFACGASGDYGISWLGESESLPTALENRWHNVGRAPYFKRDSRASFKSPVVPPLHQHRLAQLYPRANRIWPSLKASMPLQYVISADPWLYDATPKPLNHNIIPSYADEHANIKLSCLDVDGVADLLMNMKELQNSSNLKKYIDIIKNNNIIGSVLFHCDLDDLKKTMEMTFGDWELFKVLIISLRENQMLLRDDEDKNTKAQPKQSTFPPHERKGSYPSKIQSSGGNVDQIDSKTRNTSKQCETEKQVTMEDQLICGALQTLNEEACEDVMEETEDCKTIGVSLPLADTDPDELPALQDRTPTTSIPITTAASAQGDTDLLQQDGRGIRRIHRPSSLLISHPEELNQILTLEERKAAHAAIIRSSSVDDNNLQRGVFSSHWMDTNDFQCQYNTTLSNPNMPVFTITPALSGSTESSDDNDDENTPLVTTDVGTHQSCNLQLNIEHSSRGAEEANVGHKHQIDIDGMFCSHLYVDERNRGNKFVNTVEHRSNSFGNVNDGQIKWSDSETAV